MSVSVESEAVSRCGIVAPFSQMLCDRRHPIRREIAAGQKWGKLTDDDIAAINGKREQLEGKIQDRYGHTKQQVKKDVDDWHGSLK